MGTQGTGRKRSTKKERSTAEDDALNLIAREVSGGCVSVVQSNISALSWSEARTQVPPQPSSSHMTPKPTFIWTVEKLTPELMSVISVECSHLHLSPTECKTKSL